MALFSNKDKKWLVGLEDIETAAYWLIGEYDFMLKEYAPILVFALTGINYFCSNYASFRGKPDENEEKVLALNTLGYMEISLAKENMDYHEKLINSLTEYWDDYLDGNREKEADILSYLTRCLTISGVFKFYCYYVHNFSDEMENGAERIKERKELFKILDKDGSVYDMIEYLNTKNCDEDDEIMLTMLYNGIALCVFKAYRKMCNKKKLDDLFDVFKENSLARLHRGAFISSCKYIRP